MRRATRVLVAVAVLAALARALPGDEAITTSTTSSEPDDDEGDSAPFMVAVRHADGRSCAAALVSLRTALSSAACARPRLGGDDVWLAAHSGRVRVQRIAYATGGDADADGGVAGDPWAGAAADIALLELAAPLPAARAILMATDAADCAPPAHCHLVRRLPPTNTSGDESARLRIVDARLDEGGECAARGPRWPALRARTLCLAGPTLCQSDWGTGVVCSGRLCGVVSRSAGTAGEGEGQGERCGGVHAAASVPRWRRFLHCAHTRDACGRDGDCTDLCKETWVADVPSSSESPSSAPTPALSSIPDVSLAPALLTAPTPSSAHRKPLRTNQWPITKSSKVSTPRRTESSHGTAAFSSATLALGAVGPAGVTADAVGPVGATLPVAGAVSQRSAFEFEPNRADFRAGEYGDNAAEYLAPDEGAAAASPCTAERAREPTRTAPRAAAARDSAQREAAAVQLASASASASRWRPDAHRPPALLLLTAMCFCYRVI